MKNLISLIIIIVFVSHQLYAQSLEENCISCTKNEINHLNVASALGIQNISTGLASFASGKLCSATGGYSLAMGYDCAATANYSFAFGKNTLADEIYAFSFGKYSESLGAASFSMGTYLKANNQYSIVIGKGYGYSSRLENSLENTLMVGFNSIYPTLFVSPAPSGGDKTGKIGIGNITDPQAKLHIKADNTENATLFLQPSDWDNKYAELSLGTSANSIKAAKGVGLSFKTEKDFLFNEGNVGIGTNNPIGKLQVSGGDIFIEDINSGIIMKSPDGQCWRGKLDNSGQLHFEQIDCDDLLVGVVDSSPGNSPLINIYPNPTGNRVVVLMEKTFAGTHLEVTNLNGTKFYVEKIENSEFTIDLTRYASGIYVFNIIGLDGKLIASKKIIKN